MSRSRILAFTGIWIVLLTCSLVCAFGSSEGFSLVLKDERLVHLWPSSQGRVSGVSRRAPVFSFEGLIVYSGIDHNLWLLNGTTADRIRITSDGAPGGKQYLNPAWSPDGTKLVFISQELGQENEVFLIRAWSGKVEKIGQGWEMGAYPWSEDSSMLIYSNLWSKDDTQPRGIWTYDLSSSESKLLLANDKTKGLYEPDWAPQGGMISFHEYCAECAGRLSTMAYHLPEIRYDWGMAGTNQQPGGNSDWSADGEWLVFDEWKHQGWPGATGGVWKGSADGQLIECIYKDNQRIAVQPKMSPNGHTIAFGSMALRAAGGNAIADLVLIDEFGSHPERVYLGRSAIWPQAWSKNSKQVLFIDEGPADDRQPRWRSTDALLIYDLDKKQTFQVADVGRVKGRMGAAWSTTVDVNFYPWPAKQNAGPVVPLERPFHYDRQTVIYLKPNQRLALHNLGHDENIELPTVEKVQQFFLSPHQRFVFYQAESGRARVLVFDPPEQNVITTVQDFPLSSEPGTPQLFPTAKPRTQKIDDVFLMAFSQQEMPFAYMDRFGHTWLVQPDGVEEQLSYAFGPPAWSSDGRWLSFITLDGRLYLADGEGPFQLIAQNVESGSMQWSPDGTKLAYTQRFQDSSKEGDPRIGKVYDTVQGKDIHVISEGGIWGWSQNGQLLALENLDPADTKGEFFDYLLYNPQNQTSRDLGLQSTAGSGRHGWTAEAPPYIFNRFQVIDMNLKSDNSLRVIRENLLAASADGRTFLGTVTTDDQFSTSGAIYVHFHCWYEPDGAPMATVGNWTDTPFLVGPKKADETSIMRGYLSSNGKWAAVVYRQNGLLKLHLGTCSSSVHMEVEAEDWPVLSGQGPFSPNGYWWGSNVKESDHWNLHLRSLNENSVGARVSIPTADGSVFYWFGDGK